MQIFKFVANLNFLFNDLPFMERFSAASKAGFKYVEFMFPYDYQINEIKDTLTRNELELILFNLPVGNWDKGDRGIAVDPKRSLEFREGVKQAIEIAKELDVQNINCLVGISNELSSKEEIRHNLVENLIYAADEFKKHNIDLMIEPINHFDIPGFYLNTTKEVIDVIEEVNRLNVYLQYDIYHAARENENLNEVLELYWDKIGHIQLADSPNRFEPGEGEIDYASIFNMLESKKYNEYISMEYKPSSNTEKSLDWLKNFNYKL